MLRWRLLLGVLLAAGFIGLCWLDHHAAFPGIWLAPLSLLAAVLATGEIIGLLSAIDVHPRSALLYPANLLIVASSWMPLLGGRWSSDAPFASLAWSLATFIVCVLAALIWEVVAYRRPGGITIRLAATLLGLVYVGLLLSFAVHLRSLGGGRLGIGALLTTILIVKLGDTGAYIVGRLFGRHKLAPHLSPGKTIEGAFGGIAFACFGAWIGLVWLMPRIAPSWSSGYSWLLFGILVGVAGMIGDLAESLLKRDVGRKDSSTWFPGFGGVLDVLDSILLAAPVAYLCWVAGLAGS